MVTFVVASAAHAFYVWNHNDLTSINKGTNRFKERIIGFHTQSSIRKSVESEAIDKAILLLKFRDYSFIALVILSVFEYIIR